MTDIFLLKKLFKSLSLEQFLRRILFVSSVCQKRKFQILLYVDFLRSALMTAVYRKTFKLSSVHNEGAGNVVSLVSTDCSKLYEGVLAFHNVWTAPLETAAIIALLLSQVKISKCMEVQHIITFPQVLILVT